MAEERGKTVSWAFFRSVIKKEGPYRFFVNHMFPPLIINTTIGLTLFGTYSTTEHALEKRVENDYVVRAIAGATAGAAQSVISAPLDNLRLALVMKQQTSKGGQKRVFTGWWPLIRSTLFAPGVQDVDLAGRPTTRTGRLKAWASRGWAMGGLSVLKDSMGFAAFFTIFQLGRDMGRWVADRVDRSIHTLEETRRSWTGRVFQSGVIVLSGATAGWAYGVVGEPVEVLRRTIWRCRVEWGKLQEARPCQTAGSSVPFIMTDKSSAQASCHQNSVTPKPSPAPHIQLRNRLGLERSRLEAKLMKFHATHNPLHSPSLPSAFSILRWNIREHGIIKLMRSSASKPRPPPTATPPGTLFGPKRVTAFRSFVLSPYAVGFFVWAVCSGDLI